MSAKDNFAQAMKELLNSGEAGGAVSSEESRTPNSFSSFSAPDSRPPKAPAPEKQESVFGGGSFGSATSSKGSDVDATDDEKDSDAAFEAVSDAKPVLEEVPEDEPASAEAQVASQESTIAENATPTSDAVTVIAPGTTIVGNLTSNGSLVMNGDIKGDVKVARKFTLEGRVIGDVDAQEVEIIRSSVKGNITVTGDLEMDDHTIVVGDISAKNTTTNGKIKGNLTVLERGHLKPSATLVGNLVAGTVIIDEGAMLKGDIAITNAQNENIVVDEPEFDIQL